MPSFFSEGNTPWLRDTRWRSLEKILGATIAGGGGGGGNPIYTGAAPPAAPADITKGALFTPDDTTQPFQAWTPGVGWTVRLMLTMLVPIVLLFGGTRRVEAAGTYLLLTQTNALAAGITNEAKAYTDAQIASHPGGTVGTLVNTTATAAGQIVKFTGTDKTNTAPSTALAEVAGTNVTVAGIASANAMTATNGLAAGGTSTFFSPAVPITNIKFGYDSATYGALMYNAGGNTKAGLFNTFNDAGAVLSLGVRGVAAGNEKLQIGDSLATFLTPVTITNSATGTVPFSIGGYSLTGSQAQSMVSLAGTLNTSGSPDVFKIAITDTSHGASTKLLNFYGGASGTTSLFSVDTSGKTSIASSGNSFNPNLVFGSASGYGFAQDNAGFSWANGSVLGLEFIPTSVLSLSSGAAIAWTSSASSAAQAGDDLFILRDAANTLQIGSDGATPSAQAFKGPDGSGTDKDGGALTIEGGQSTGTGRGGSLIARTSTTSATSGSTANNYQDRAHYAAKFVTLTDATATSIFTVTMPTTNLLGMSFVCTVQASDGTDFQSLTSTVTVDAVNKGGTITAVISPSSAQTALAGSAGTLSVTYTAVDAGSNVLAVKCNADTSLTSTFLRAKVVMHAINPMGAGVVVNEL